MSCARIDGQARSSDDGQTRSRYRPAIGIVRASELDHSKVRRCVQVAGDIVIGDAIDWLIADRRAGAFKVRPRRRATDRVVRHQEDVAGMRVSKGCSDQLVVAEIRHVSTIWISGIDRDAANRPVR